MTDVVLPKNNEKEFVGVASSLGFKKIYFLYNFDEYNHNKIQEKLQLIEKQSKISMETGFIVNQKNLNKAFKESKFLVMKSSDKDRFFIESKKIKLIYGFEETKKRDYLHQRASGLNHVVCELAKKNDVVIGFSYSLLLNENESHASLLMGRMMQNIKLCQKYKVKTIIGSFSDKPYHLRAPHDLMSLFSMLGMSSKNIRDSMISNL